MDRSAVSRARAHERSLGRPRFRATGSRLRPASLDRRTGGDCEPLDDDALLGAHGATLANGRRQAEGRAHHGRTVPLCPPPDLCAIATADGVHGCDCSKLADAGGCRGPVRAHGSKGAIRGAASLGPPWRNLSRLRRAHRTLPAPASPVEASIATHPPTIRSGRRALTQTRHSSMSLGSWRWALCVAALFASAAPGAEDDAPALAPETGAAATTPRIALHLDREAEDRILALVPEKISDSEMQSVLALAPA